MYEPLFKLEMIDDQTATLHMKDLHARAISVDKDKGISILNIHAHLIGDDATQCVEVLPHISWMGIQEEPVCIIQAEHSSTCSSLSADRALMPQSHRTGGLSRHWGIRSRSLAAPYHDGDVPAAVYRYLPERPCRHDCLYSLA